MMLRRRYGAVGMLALPYFLVFEFAGPLMEAAAWIAFPIGISLGVDRRPDRRRVHRLRVGLRHGRSR